MLNADKLKLRIIDLLKEKDDMTIGQLKKATKTAHHYTMLNALEFLEKIKLITINEKGDKLNSKIVRLKK